MSSVKSAENLASSKLYLSPPTAQEMEPAERPPGRDRHALAYDAARQRVVLFGGSEVFSSGDSMGDTWEWNGETWQEASPTESPPARAGHALAYDRDRQRVVLFGGSGATGRLNDTWVWDGTNWEELSPDEQPPPRAAHAIAETVLP